MWKCKKCGREFKNENQQHFCESADTVDDYIAKQPAEVQPVLQKIRQVIRASAPEALEKISWQMPTFWQNENLIHFAAFKKHIGIYPGGEAVGVFSERLKGYKTSKGSIQLPLNKPVDYELLSDITKWRVSCVSSSIDNNDRYICYCGLYCENCAVKAKVDPAAKVLYNEMKAARFEEMIQFIPDGISFWSFLKDMAENGSCVSCKEGSGNPRCEIRKCAKEKGIEICAICENYPCAHFSEIIKNYPILEDDNKIYSEKGKDAWIKLQTGRCEKSL